MMQQMTFTAEIGTSQLAELVKQVQAGHEVLLMQGDKPVAKLVPASEKEVSSERQFTVRSAKGHRVLTPVITQADIAEDMFNRQ